MQIKVVNLNEEYKKQLINLSKIWAQENCTYGLVENSESDLKEPVSVALKGDKIIGYAFGHFYNEQETRSYIEVGSACFSVDEFYVLPEYRSKGIGKKIFKALESEVMGKCAYITFCTSTKNYEAILKLYTKELGMVFHSAFLIKKT